MKNWKVNLLFSANVKKMALENYEVELRRECWPCLLATRGAASMHQLRTCGTQMWARTYINYTVNMPQEMPGNGGKLNVTPEVPKVYCVLLISFMGVRLTLQLGCRQSVPQLFIAIPNTWQALMEATICQKGNSHIFSQPKMRKSCYSKVTDIISSGKGGGWR